MARAPCHALPWSRSLLQQRRARNFSIGLASICTPAVCAPAGTTHSHPPNTTETTPTTPLACSRSDTTQGSGGWDGGRRDGQTPSPTIASACCSSSAGQERAGAVAAVVAAASWATLELDTRSAASVAGAKAWPAGGRPMHPNADPWPAVFGHDATGCRARPSGIVIDPCMCWSGRDSRRLIACEALPEWIRHHHTSHHRSCRR